MTGENTLDVLNSHTCRRSSITFTLTPAAIHRLPQQACGERKSFQSVKLTISRGSDCVLGKEECAVWGQAGCDRQVQYLLSPLPGVGFECGCCISEVDAWLVSAFQRALSECAFNNCSRQPASQPAFCVLCVYVFRDRSRESIMLSNNVLSRHSLLGSRTMEYYFISGYTNEFSL